ncbi:MAG: TetR/AcrR family transcriptional regulator [Ruminococcaceae bacterium]|nr:TetR/AcrR family transcriptional regulator [Oscillospiraceae bacterium]
MDRRQKKTRNAIFRSFIDLLSERNFQAITVEQIIAGADVGRATFYAHFETKDALLRALSQELFDHVAQAGAEAGQLFSCQAPDSPFLHLVQHLQKNDNQILRLLSGQNEPLFAQSFREGLKRLVRSQLPLFAHRKDPRLPEEFWVEHIASVFVDTVRWWTDTGRKESPETVTEYFMLSV